MALGKYQRIIFWFVRYNSFKILFLFIMQSISASKPERNSTNLEAGDYDLIHYAYGYNTIEEMDEKVNTLPTNFPPRHGTLPSPGYSGLKPDEPKPPGVYTRMGHQKNHIQETNVDRTNPQSGIDASNPDHSTLSNVEETTMKKASSVNAYLVLEP